MGTNREIETRKPNKQGEQLTSLNKEANNICSFFFYQQDILTYINLTYYKPCLLY